ncbi:hypothetical protein G3N56_09125 [Desulfovibrio sulfodismutans]|uniref:Uncharacterized protein n=1 Tax=Desulfolutivibrio sulfodismutans TaxID=63561 RepID=A0A7K3NL46_9BACT|nr:hypothetical protein [Desulfolutivibrio sulfodismutans]NDY56902.1 hypothetical protein [Desulfolutivibrio sulfodismutans]QLA12928.1 hypothetical protein GD606_11910 [Desulfolutivibrio sulfodismutans DSM 3696]
MPKITIELCHFSVQRSQFNILPKEIDHLKVVIWACNNYLESFSSIILKPMVQIIENIQHWIAARWDVTIKDICYKPHENNREAVGWYNNYAVYIPSSSIVEAAGNAAKKEHIAKILSEQGLLFKRHSAKQATINYVSGIGAGKFYALDRYKLQLRTTGQNLSQPEADDD